MPFPMTGSILNAAGIVIGGILGLLLKRQFSGPTQQACRSVMGLLTVLLGLILTCFSFHGNVFQIFKQIVVMFLGLMIGRIVGRLFRIQRMMNVLGKYAAKRFERMRPDEPNRLNEGFIVCALLFCAAPLGPIGAVEDGLIGYWPPLLIKMVMDGLAAMGFVRVFGWGVTLSAIPVFAYQGTITLVIHNLEPWLRTNGLVDSIDAVGGMLVFCVALMIMELKKLQLGDYLPSLIVAPFITWLWS